MTDKNEIIKKIISKANNLNVKIRKFQKEGINEHSNFIQNAFNSEQMIFNKSGSLTKSKKFYEKQNILQLRKTLILIDKLSKHDIYGTVRKYKKYSTERWKTTKHTLTTYFIEKGYSKQLINEILNNKNFYSSLHTAFAEKKTGYGSLQISEKVFLDYSNGKISQEEINKVLSNIEYSVNLQKEIEREHREYKEYLEWKRQKNRR